MGNGVGSSVERGLLSPWAPFGAGALSFLVYRSCVCPHALAGDSSIFQIRAVTLSLDSAAQTHPLFLLLGHAFLKLPWSSVPLGLTVLCAIFGATAVGLVFAVTRLLTGRGLAALCAAVALCVAHTMWFHAVITEVYSLNAAVLAATLFLAVSWSNGGRRWELFALAFLSGLACTNHMLAGLSLAVLAIWATAHTWRTKRPWRDLLLAAGFVLLGATLLLVLTVRDARLLGPAAAVRRALSGGTGITGAATVDYSASMPGSGRAPIRQIVAAVCALVYNFPGASALLGGAGLRALAQERRPAGVLLIALFAVDFLFGSTYAVNDFWVFLLPAWVVFSVAVGVGCDRLLRAAAQRWPAGSSRIAVALVLGVATCPVALYWALPRLVNHAGVAALRERQDRGQVVIDKDYWEFYMWPPKSSQSADARWVEAVLAAVPEGGTLVSREAYLALIRYEQIVEGKRRDIRAFAVSPRNIRCALDSGNTVFVAAAADLEQDGIDPGSLGARLERSGPVWRLVRER